jgi:transcriptional regulator with XRE-family HTH domain
MAHHSKTAFGFGPELRARLRELRKRRGLTLRAMALLMDRTRAGAHVQLARLEKGQVKYPSINLIADYLRACGAGFDDLLDLLKPQTSQPPVLKQKGDAAVAELLKSLPKPEQRAMLKWERGIVAAREAMATPTPAKKQPKPETDRQRVFRVVWSFIHANWNEVFEQKLYEAMLKLKDEVGPSRRKAACNIGRRFFGVLTRYYRHESRRSGTLERVERAAKKEGFSDRAVAMLRDAANQAYGELLRSGRLDWEPTPEELVKKRGHAPRVEKAEVRLEMDDVRPEAETNKTLALIESLAIIAVGGRLDKMRVALDKGQEYYFWWIRELVTIAYERGTDSPEWKASVEKWAPKLHEPEFAREAAQMTADIYNRWKIKLPPRPD